LFLLHIFISFNLSFSPWITTGSPDTVFCQVFPRLYEYDGNIYLLAGVYYRDKGGLIVIKNSKKMWSIDINSSVYYGFTMADSLIFVGDYSGTIYIYTLSGDLVKKIKAEKEIKDIKKSENYLFIFEGNCSTFEVLDLKSLEIVRKKKTSTMLGSMGYDVYNGRVYMTSSKGSNILTCYDVKKDTFLWSADLGLKMGAMFWILPGPNFITYMNATEEGIFVGTIFGDIFEIAENGKILKKGSAGKGRIIRSIQPIPIDENREGLLVGTYEGTLILLDRKDMKVLWRYRMVGESAEPPLILKINGKWKVLSVDKEKNLYLINIQGESEWKGRIEGDEFDESPYLIAGDIDRDGYLDLILKGSTCGRLYLSKTNILVGKGRIIKDEK